MNTPRIAYILGRYPSRSETFIRREINALRERGFTIDIYALRAGEGASSEEILYRGNVALLQKFVSLLWTASHPIKLLKVLRLMIADLAGGGRFLSFLKSLRNLPTAAYFARRILGAQTACIHAHFAGQPTVVARTISIFVTIPYTFSVHAHDIFVDNAPIVSTIVQANAVAACTRAAAAHLKSQVPESQHYKIHVVHHGIHASPMTDDRRETKQILAVGRLVEKKGYAVLLKAIRLLADNCPELTCTIVGDGPQREKLSRRARELKVNELVDFTGWLSSEDVHQRMQKAAILAVPSIRVANGDQDGLPNVVLEAAAAGLPIVASDLPGIDEFVVDGQTGLLASPGDARDLAEAIRKVLTDTNLRTSLAGAARKKVVEEFDVQANAGKLITAMDWQKQEKRRG